MPKKDKGILGTAKRSYQELLAMCNLQQLEGNEDNEKCRNQWKDKDELKLNCGELNSVKNRNELQV